MNRAFAHFVDNAIEFTIGRYKHLYTPDQFNPIPDGVIDWPNNQPESFFAIPDEPPKEFVLRFTYLKENICCYEQIDETKTKALFRKLKQITELTSKTLPASNLIRDSILNKPPYTSLFTGLPPDADVKETELPNAGRIFFWLLQEKFFVISIETKHRDIYG